MKKNIFLTLALLNIGALQAANTPVPATTPNTALTPTKKVTVDLAKKARVTAKANLQHVKNQILTAKTLGSKTLTTAVEQAQALKNGADKAGITQHITTLKTQVKQGWNTVNTPEGKSALRDWVAGKQQIAAAGGSTTVAGQAIKKSHDAYMQKNHAVMVQQATAQALAIQDTLNKFLTFEIIGALGSDDGSTGQAAVNFVEGFDAIFGPVAEYLNSPQGQALMNQMSAAVDSTK